MKTFLSKCLLPVACCLFLLAACPAWAATYHVKADGNDAAGTTGLTVADAWATISKALTTAAAGDTVHIGAGTYQSATYLTINQNFASAVTFDTESGNADVTVKGTGGNGLGCNVFIQGASNITFRRITFTMDATTSYGVWFYNLAVSGIVFDQCQFTNDSTANANQPFLVFLNPSNGVNFGITWTDCTFTNNKNVTTGQGYCIYAFFGATQTATLTLTRCSLVGIGANCGAALLIGPTLLIDDCNFYSVSGNPGLSIGYDGATAVPTAGHMRTSVMNSLGGVEGLLIGYGATNFEVSDCWIMGGTTDCVVIKGGGVTFQRNRVISDCFTPLLIKGSDAAQVLNNWVLAPNGTALNNYDGGAVVDSNCVVTGNHFAAMTPANACVNWNISGDGGKNVVNGNRYVLLSGVGHVGVPVLGSSIVDTLAALQAAWSGYSPAGNDSSSTVVTMTLGQFLKAMLSETGGGALHL